MSDILQSSRLWLGLLAALAASTACGQTQAGATVPTEADANEIIHALYARNIEARKELAGEGHGSSSSSNRRQQWQVFVSESLFEENKLAASLRVLHEHGLPRPTDEGFEKAYEEGGMFPSESAQKAQRLKELKTEIERQLRYLPSVMRVSANIVMPEDSGINIDPYPATASVLIVHKDEKLSFSGDYVKELVAKGVPKLKPEEVSVVLVYEPPKSAPIDGQVLPAITIGARGGGALWASCVGVLVVFAALALVLSLQRRRRRERSANEASATPGAVALDRRDAAHQSPIKLAEKEVAGGPRAPAAAAEQLS
ncbi:MAG: hypothetical protein WKF30_14910 [Pyrinomonadaceae bacterium]